MLDAQITVFIHEGDGHYSREPKDLAPLVGFITKAALNGAGSDGPPRTK